MNYDVVDVKVLSHLEFAVTFADGIIGRMQMLPSHLYGVFEKLKDPEFFNRMQVTDGFVSWPDEIDLAPAGAMYDEIRAVQCFSSGSF